MAAVKNTISEKKRKRKSGDVSTTPTTEPAIEKAHLELAYNIVASKLSTERKGFKPMKPLVEDDSVD